MDTKEPLADDNLTGNRIIRVIVGDDKVLRKITRAIFEIQKGALHGKKKIVSDIW